eukprot:30601-Prorocentrum_minimum.AAC.2
MDLSLDVSWWWEGTWSWLQIVCCMTSCSQKTSVTQYPNVQRDRLRQTVGSRCENRLGENTLKALPYVPDFKSPKP